MNLFKFLPSTSFDETQFHFLQKSFSTTKSAIPKARDNHAEGMVFSKRLDIGKTFRGGERTPKSILKTCAGKKFK